MPIQKRYEVRGLFVQVLREGGPRGVRDARGALDGRAEALFVRALAALARAVRRVPRVVERGGDDVEELILSLVLELVRVRDVAHARGERGEDDLVLRGDVRSVRRQDERPPRDELGHHRARRPVLLRGGDRPRGRVGGVGIVVTRIRHRGRRGSQVANERLELVVQRRLERRVENLHRERPVRRAEPVAPRGSARAERV